MKITYDSAQNIAYIRFQEKQAEVETIRISDELNVDMSPDGSVYGIELLNAKSQLLSVDQGKLLVVNEAMGGSGNFFDLNCLEMASVGWTADSC